MKKTAVFDIETFCPLEDIAEEELRYLKERKEYSSEEDFMRELATNPYVSILVSFCLLFPEEKRAEVFYLSEEENDEVKTFTFGDTVIEVYFRPILMNSKRLQAERKLLEILWDRLKEVGRLVTFHGGDFDLEFVKIRTAVQNLKPEGFYLYFPRRLINHVDLKDFLRVGRRNYSLRFISRRMSVSVDKGDIDSSKIRELFLKGDYRGLAEYNLRDVLITWMLYERLKDYIQKEYAVNVLKSLGFEESAKLIKYALDKGLLSSKEASELIELYKSKSQEVTEKQKGYLLDLIKNTSLDLALVCSLLSLETLEKIVKSRAEGET